MTDAAPVPTDAVPEGWDLFDGQGFVDHVGPLYVRREPNGLRSFGFVAQPKHANLIGVVHGGMLMTLADRALGVGAWDAADGRPSVTIQFDMQFLSAVQMGEFAAMTPEVMRMTKSLVFMRGTLLVGDRPTGSANAVLKILQR
jgi:uncharacterized protein (TIGR00369 family)